VEKIVDPQFPYGREIRIECKGSGTEDYQKLLDFQGKLKTLHKSDYERLRDHILKRGFSEPISVWTWKGRKHILNGHQRLKTVKDMVEKEGYKTGPLPINQIDAKSWKEARRKVLSLTSQFGRTRAEGLFNFLKDTDITPEELLADFTFADLDLVDWVDLYHPKPDDENDLGQAEVVNPDELQTVETPTGHVRMMQMILESVITEKFMEKIERLKGTYSTTNVTDTVLNAVKEFHEKGPAKKTEVKRRVRAEATQ
jgi:hypothetical protein